MAYPEDNLPKGFAVTLVDESNSRYECPICYCALKDPVQTRCGHRFCRDCLQTYIKNGSNQCPNKCRKISMGEIFPDCAAEREVLNLEVYCLNHRQGCQWTGLLRDVEKHVENCSITRANLDADVGPKLQSHQPAVPQRLESSNQVNQVRSSQKLSHSGPTEVPKLQDITDNIRQQLQALQIPNERDKDRKHKVDASYQYSSSTDSRLKHLESKYQQLEKYVESSIGKIKAEMEQLKLLAKSNSSSTSLDCNNGDFIWKILNFELHLTDARSNLRNTMYSQAFYSSVPGYKLCVRVNLDGVDIRSRNYLSIYIHLMQGDYDDIVEWPFNRRIKVAVIDRNPDQSKRKHIADILTPQSNIAALQRPTEWKSPQGYGFARFVSISRLSSRCYLADNKLTIRVQVLS